MIPFRQYILNKLQSLALVQTKDQVVISANLKFTENAHMKSCRFLLSTLGDSS